MIQIRFKNQNGLTSTFKLEVSQACIVGRSDSCDIKLPSAKVSGQHIRIRYSQSNQGWTVEDLNSTNGTYINGRRIKKIALITKDCHVQLGKSGPSLSLGLTSTSQFVQPKTASPQANNASTSIPKTRSNIKEWKPLVIIGESVIVLAISVAVGLALKGLSPSNPSHRITSTNQEQEYLSDQGGVGTETVDPALVIQDYIYFRPDFVFPHLNDEDQYRRGIGDMARVQSEHSVISGNSDRYPAFLLGNPRASDSECESPRAAGLYNPECGEIVVAFNNDQLLYEKPIDVLYVLAHEYGHHLVNLTYGNTIGRLNEELTSDCFAGYMAGLWDEHNQLSRDELERGVVLMAAVAKAEQMDSSDEHGDPGQRIGAFVGGFRMQKQEVTQEYLNFCRTLDKIIEVRS